MRDLLVCACEVGEVFSSLDLKYCVIGGIALLFRGEDRFTRDVDFTLLTGFENEQEIIRQVLGRVAGRVQDAEEFALQNRVILGQMDGIAIDIGLAGFEFELEIIQNSTLEEVLPGRHLPVVSAEDLIIMKAFANRDQDWIDIRGIVVRQSNHLNWTRINQTVTGLAELKEDQSIVDRLSQIERFFD